MPGLPSWCDLGQIKLSALSLFFCKLGMSHHRGLLRRIGWLWQRFPCRRLLSDIGAGKGPLSGYCLYFLFRVRP